MEINHWDVALFSWPETFAIEIVHTRLEFPGSFITGGFVSNSLIILDKNSKDKIEKSVRNIPNVKVTDVNHFSAYDIIKFKKVVFTESSVKELEKRYS